MFVAIFLFTSLVSEGVLAFLRCRNIDIYGVHKHVKFLRHLGSPVKKRCAYTGYMFVASFLFRRLAPRLERELPL
jgi:hypothetical protein